jgi:hypothetical protein
MSPPSSRGPPARPAGRAVTQPGTIAHTRNHTRPRARWFESTCAHKKYQVSCHIGDCRTRSGKACVGPTDVASSGRSRNPLPGGVGTRGFLPTTSGYATARLHRSYIAELEKYGRVCAGGVRMDPPRLHHRRSTIKRRSSTQLACTRPHDRRWGHGAQRDPRRLGRQ